MMVINNPTPKDEENIAIARQKGWKVEGQLEEAPTTGTPHYQLIVNTPSIRWSQMVSAFPRACIEPAIAPSSLKEYCHKEETRIGELEAPSEYYPSMQKLWDMFYVYIEENEEKLKFTHPKNIEMRLTIFDRFINKIITEGYCVESIAVNPQVRSSVKLYGASILERSRTRVLGQTQDTGHRTQDNLVSDSNITNATIQEEENCSSAEGESNKGREVVETDEEGSSEDS